MAEWITTAPSQQSCGCRLVDKPPIQIVAETEDTVTLTRATFEALLDELEDAEDRAALLEHDLAKLNGTLPPPLTLEQLDMEREFEEGMANLLYRSGVPE